MYGTQAESTPPVFVFFVNQPKLVNASYERFLEKQIRSYLGPFDGIPIKLLFKSKRPPVEKS